LGIVPLYSSVSDMDPETAAVFLYLLREDRPSSATHTAADMDAKMREISDRLK
jgi:hypothetical protein